jgi:hypothetical protein
MVQTKKMNESLLAKMLKELDVAGELIRARQDEKQALLDEFDSECKRFFFGKISKRALDSSVRKTNNELQSLDSEIRKNITKCRRISDRVEKFASAQAPIFFRATLSGVAGGKVKAVKRKKVSKRKPVKKKKVVKKKKQVRKKKKR